MMNGAAPLAFRLASQRDLSGRETKGEVEHRSPAFALDIAGHLDLCGPELVEGWIFWRSRPQEALRLEVFIEGVCHGECVADRYRMDLQQAGFGDGRCAFRFELPRSAAARDFSTARLRLANSVMYLLPDPATKLWQPRGRSGASTRNAVASQASSSAA
jgi:hypothetical protein